MQAAKKTEERTRGCRSDSCPKKPGAKKHTKKNGQPPIRDPLTPTVRLQIGGLMLSDPRDSLSAG